MSRKDSKGRVLKQGESQRSNGTYMYRYTDLFGKRQTVYAKTLNDLRQKEAEIESNIARGVSLQSNNTTVAELIDSYLDKKKDVKESTQALYKHWGDIVKKSYLGSMKIKDIKPSTAKEFYLRMYENGQGYPSLRVIRAVLNPAFEMALQDDIILRNPFTISIPISETANTRQALTESEEKTMIECISGTRYYEIAYLLLHTGMRIGEMCGLTLSDLDFENRLIDINKQAVLPFDAKVPIITPPKSNAGYRVIPMVEDTDNVLAAIIRNSKHMGLEHDGYSGFLFSKQNGELKHAKCFYEFFNGMCDLIEEKSGIRMYITPHVLRHTFCTRLIQRGVNIKTAQYIMGHANADVTMNIYAHVDKENAISEMQNLHQNLHQFTPRYAKLCQDMPVIDGEIEYEIDKSAIDKPNNETS